MNAFDEQIIETKTLNGETEFGIKEDYITISRNEYNTLLKSATETGKWSFRFIISLLLMLFTILAFAYVADGLSTEIDTLKSKMEVTK